MADPTKTGLQISIKTTTATNAGEKVKITNLSRSGVINGELTAKKEFICNPKDTYPAWVTGDDIIVEIHGRLQGYATATLTKSGANVILNDAADANTVAVDL